jgi:hypothetical protein
MQLVEKLRYEPAGCEFDSQWSLYISGRALALGSIRLKEE